LWWHKSFTVENSFRRGSGVDYKIREEEEVAKGKSTGCSRRKMIT